MDRVSRSRRDICSAPRADRRLHLSGSLSFWGPLCAVFSTRVFQTAWTPLESAGVLHAIIRMQNQGWKVDDRLHTYNGGSGHGIDLVFQKTDANGCTVFAVTEAKAGVDSYRGMIKLDNAKTRFGDRMQGSAEYNVDRQERLRAKAGTAPEMKQRASELLPAYDTGNVENYASFARSDRLIRIDAGVHVRRDMRQPGSFQTRSWVSRWST